MNKAKMGHEKTSNLRVGSSNLSGRANKINGLNCVTHSRRSPRFPNTCLNCQTQFNLFNPHRLITL